MVAWPISSCTALSGTPRMTRCEAKVWRSTCQPNGTSCPARSVMVWSARVQPCLSRRSPSRRANTHRPRCGWSPRACSAWSERGISRARPPLGVLSTPCQTERRTSSRPAWRSTSSHRRASNSPIRRPVRRATTTWADHVGDSAAASMKASASANERNRIESGGSVSFPTLGATASTPRSTEKRSNLPSTPSTLLTVLGFRPSVIARANRSMRSGVTSVTRRLPKDGTTRR